MADFKEIIIGVALIMLIFYCMVNFAQTFITDNNSTMTLTNDGVLNAALGNITTEMDSYDELSNSSRAGWNEEQSHPTITTLGFVFHSILDLGTNFISSAITTINIIFTMAVQYVDPKILSLLAAILVIIMILAAWRVVRAGE
jgi:hypothetical protein